MLYSEVHVHQDLEWWQATFWREALEQAKKFLDVMCNAKNCSQIGSRSNVAFSEFSPRNLQMWLKSEFVISIHRLSSDASWWNSWLMIGGQQTTFWKNLWKQISY